MTQSAYREPRASLSRFALFAMLLGASTAQAQTSPIADLLARARGALNDLRYSDASSITTMVLATFDKQMDAAQRFEALTIGAAAAFPDPAGGAVQRPDSALVLLRRIVRLDPTVRLQPDLSWPGLDSLFGSARRSTFAVIARATDENILTGASGEAAVEVFSTRPARFRLSRRVGSGGQIVDTAGPAERAVLKLRSFNGDRVMLSNGEHVVDIVAIDATTGDSTTLTYNATAIAVPLELVVVPSRIDSSKLRPELASPAKRRAVVAALLLGGSTALAVSLKGSAPLTAASADSRGYVVAVALAAGALTGAMIDRSRPLPRNIARNRLLRTQFEESVRVARAENQRRVAAHRITLTLRRRAD